MTLCSTSSDALHCPRTESGAEPSGSAAPVGEMAGGESGNWPERDVLVGSLRQKVQLDICLRHRFYHIPAYRIRESDFPIRYVALYQSKHLFGPAAGIRYYGEVIRCLSVHRAEIREIPSSRTTPYYRLEIREWKCLDPPIAVGDKGIITAMTNLFLLRHCTRVPELSIGSETEYRLYMGLIHALEEYPARRISFHRHLSIGSFSLCLDNGRVALSNGTQVALCGVAVCLNDPYAAFCRLWTTLKKGKGFPQKSP